MFITSLLSARLCGQCSQFVCQSKGKLLAWSVNLAVAKRRWLCPFCRWSKPPGRIVSGEILVKWREYCRNAEKRTAQSALDRAGIDPSRCDELLNPVTKIKEQMADGIQAHEQIKVSCVEGKNTTSCSNDVGLPERVYNMYPSRTERWHEAARVHCHGGCRSIRRSFWRMSHQCAGCRRAAVWSRRLCWMSRSDWVSQ